MNTRSGDSVDKLSHPVRKFPLEPTVPVPAMAHGTPMWPFVPRSGIVEGAEHAPRERGPGSETRRSHHDYADYLGKIAGRLLAGV
jgi:hypothetical protein